MSSSSLWGINEKLYGEEILEFKNAWLFTPVACDILFQKYLPQKINSPYGKRNYMAAIMFDNSIHRELNVKINNCGIQEDRIVWEMTNQQMFYVKDKQFIADCVDKFLVTNKKFTGALGDHIFDRFSEIAKAILELDENEHSYFVFKNTSVDDGVEYWFETLNEETDEYEKRSLLDLDNYVTELVVVRDNCVDKFVSNTELKSFLRL